METPTASTRKWKAISNGSPWASGGSDVGKSERCSVMERIRVQDLPDSKGSRHPTGAGSRERDEND